MTDLEKEIYKHALEIIPELEKKIIDVIKTNPDKICSNFVEIPFFCMGVWDSIIYDIKLGKFTKINYAKGVGEATHFEGMSKNTAYFDDVEFCGFEIP